VNQPAARPAFTCDESEALLPLVADGQLDPDGDPTLFEHLARCEDCQRSLARHDLVTLALSDPARPRLRLAPRAITWRLPWPAAVAASLLAAFGLWLALDAHGARRDAARQPQVIRIDQPGQAKPVYVVIDANGATIIDPQAGDGRARPANGDAPIPVKY
jgi:hypothetical protein